MIDRITYDEALMAGADILLNDVWGKPQVIADLIAAMFNKTNGEVYIDLQAERRELRKVM